MSAADVLDALTADRALVVVRATRLEDPAGLCAALVAGGIRVVELTYTTPGLVDLLRLASRADTGALVGAGTVLTRDQASAALDAGASFLVTPGLTPEAEGIVAAAHDAGAAVVLGALTPSEVATALALGADAVKIFPARTVGPRYLTDLHGPFPDARLVPSGGVEESNAADYLRAGALAVTAGTSVVPPRAVDGARWADITGAAARFCAALR